MFHLLFYKFSFLSAEKWEKLNIKITGLAVREKKGKGKVGEVGDR